MASSRLQLRASNAFLLLVICLSLPLTTLLLWFNYAAVVLTEQRSRLFLRQRQRQRQKSAKTILITGASSAHGLNVAQAFYKEGHRVVAVDLGQGGILSISRRSRAISKHYAIPQLAATDDTSYAARCLFIVAKNERADIWIDCSQGIELDIITSAQQQIKEGTSCVCIAPSHANAQLLKSKEALLDFLRDKQLPAPKKYRVKSRGEIHDVLNRSRGQQQFLLTSPTTEKSVKAGTVLPRRTPSQTYQEVSMLKIEPNSELLLEEYFDPSNTYQCSVIVVQGVVKAFSARQRTKEINSNFYDGCALWRALRAYTDAIGRELGQAFTGHLVLLFLLNEKVTNEGVVQQVIPVEGSVHIDPTFVFPRLEHTSNSLVSAYLSALPHQANGASTTLKQTRKSESLPIKTVQSARQRYFLSEDVENLAFRPSMQLLLWRTSPAQVGKGIFTLAQRLLFWDEAYYDFCDPLPAFWRYSIVLAWETFAAA